LASIDELTAPARDVATAIGEDPKQADGGRLLEQLAGLAGDTRHIDRRRPFAIVLCAPRATPPTVVFLAPATDPAKYAASLEGRGLAALAEGGYVAVPLGGKYEKPAAPSQFASAPATGLVSLRVDVATMATHLGVPIGAGLTAFQATMANVMQASGAGLDGEAMAEMYVSAARTLLASTAALDVRLDYRDGQLQATGSLTAKPGSDMDGWGSPPADLTKLEGRLSGVGSFEFLCAADWTKLWPRLETMLAALFEVYPAKTRESMRSLMAGYRGVYEKLGPVMAAEGDLFGDKGLGVVMHVTPPDAKALLPLLESTMAKPELAQLGATFSSVGASDADGTTVRDYRAKFDLDKLFAGMSRSGTEKQVAALFEKLLGKDGLPLRFAAKGDHAVMTLGQPRDDVAASPGTARGTWSPSTSAALQHVRDCNPMFYERLDAAALMRMARQISGAGTPMRDVPANATANFGLWGGIRDREWRFGAAIDIVGFSKMVKAMMPR
jgi:hypothetical protein